VRSWYTPRSTVGGVLGQDQQYGSLGPILPPIFASYHLGYGIGFLQGLVDFALPRSRPRAGMVRLTR